jgi:hypothetical protein
MREEIGITILTFPWCCASSDGRQRTNFSAVNCMVLSRSQSQGKVLCHRSHKNSVFVSCWRGVNYVALFLGREWF